MQAVLVMFRPDGERRSFSVVRDITVVGRGESCDLRIPLSEVSRKHCRIVRDGDTLRLEDLGSSNGTYLNAQRIQEALLQPGDSLQVGPVVFVLQVDGGPADDELNPVMVDAAAAAAAAGGGVDELEELPADDAHATGHAGAAEEEAGSAATEGELLGDTDDLQPLGEDAGFDILAGDDDAAEGSNLDLDTEKRRR
jgi:predicted component of type VI protein secretion system